MCAPNPTPKAHWLIHHFNVGMEKPMVFRSTSQPVVYKHSHTALQHVSPMALLPWGTRLSWRARFGGLGDPPICLAPGGGCAHLIVFSVCMYTTNATFTINKLALWIHAHCLRRYGSPPKRRHTPVILPFRRYGWIHGSRYVCHLLSRNSKRYKFDFREIPSGKLT